METIVNEIAAAEARAQDMLSAAREEAKGIAEQANADAEHLLAESKDAAKIARAQTLAKAESDAQRAYDQALKEGIKTSTRRAVAAGEKLEAAADKIAEAILNGNR